MSVDIVRHRRWTAEKVPGHTNLCLFMKLASTKCLLHDRLVDAEPTGHSSGLHKAESSIGRMVFPTQGTASVV